VLERVRACEFALDDLVSFLVLWGTINALYGQWLPVGVAGLFCLVLLRTDRYDLETVRAALPGFETDGSAVHRSRAVSGPIPTAGNSGRYLLRSGGTHWHGDEGPVECPVCREPPDASQQLEDHLFTEHLETKAAEVHRGRNGRAGKRRRGRVAPPVVSRVERGPREQETGAECDRGRSGCASARVDGWRAPVGGRTRTKDIRYPNRVPPWGGSKYSSH